MTVQPEQSERKGLDWPLIGFFILAYAIAWGALAILGVIARQSGIDSALALLEMGETLQFGGAALSAPRWLVYLLTRLADFAFSISGVIVIAVTAGRGGLRELWARLTRWRISWKWYVAGLLPIFLYGLATIVAGGTGTADFSANTLYTMLFSVSGGLFVSLFLRGAFGEELGLRGFALPHLQKRMAPFRASLIIGFFWGAWHLPVLLGRDPISIVAFILLSFGLSFIFTWLFNGSGESLIPGLLFHATQNWEEGFETLFPGLIGTDWELVSTLGLLIVGLIAGVVVWRQGRREGDD